MEVVDVKYRAVMDYMDRKRSATEICSSLGISSGTPRRWTKRFREEGIKGLFSKSRAPKRVHNKLSGRRREAADREHAQLELSRFQGRYNKERRHAESAG